MKKKGILIILVGLARLAGAQTDHDRTLVKKRGTTVEQIVRAFQSIDTSPHSIRYQNQREVPQQGGHIQGVQSINKAGHEYVFLSGSSASYSYCAVMKVGRKNEVIAVHKMLEKPFKHAGGFQLYEQYLAIGMEDDEAKDKSRIHVYQIDDPEQPLRQPLAIIERTGEPRRSTAGCVGITTLREKMLVVVGDWDSRHLDFYLSDRPASATQPLAFELVYTIDVAAIDKQDWSDSQWLSYQNINLLKDEADNLYVVGLAQDAKGQDVADLFQLETQDFTTFQLKKVATKIFTATQGTSFKWGAGISYDESNNNMRILSSPAHVDKEAVLNEYH